MPIAGMSPPKVMQTEMHKFKAGELHSGSKSGPVVKSRAQAIAIGLSEARKAGKGASSKPGLGGPDPRERSVAAPDVVLVHTAAGQGGRSFDAHMPMAARGMERGPRKLGPAPAPLRAEHSHGYRHDATQRQGHLRTSGHSGAHQIGKR